MKRRNLFRTVFGPGRSTLWLIAAMLLGSAVLRVGIGANGAIALESDAMAKEKPIEAMAPKADANSGPGESGAEIVAILRTLAEREEGLDAREAALRDRMAALALAEQEIERNLKALEQAEEELSATLALAATAAEDDLTRLTAVYESMKPKEAATLFEEMSPDFAAGFLGRMRPEAAAAVMAGLDATTAYSISVILAGRNANVPTE